jgi:hypothetical protein
MGSDKNGVAKLGFLAGETIVGILHRSAHIYPVEADFQVNLVHQDADAGSGRKGVFEVGFGVKVVGIPATAHGAKIFAETQGIHAAPGIERKSGKRGGEGNLGGGSEGPLKLSFLLSADIQGDKQGPYNKERYARARKKMENGGGEGA